MAPVFFLQYPAHHSAPVKLRTLLRGLRDGQGPSPWANKIQSILEGNPMQSENLIDLRKPRVIVIEDRGHSYTLTVAPITRKRWIEYFRGIVSTSEFVKGSLTDSFDSSGARLALVNDTLIDADGYLINGVMRVTEIDGWKNLIPVSHRVTVGNVLTMVERSAEDESPIMLGGEVVCLDAVWGRHASGAMQKVRGLRHTFASPSVEQQRRYSRDKSRSQVIGGSRYGKTRWLGAQATLAELYDELILSVEGYAINGVPLDDDRDQIIESMDTYHKVAAAESLFVPVAPKVAEDDDAQA
jgi:hypothetical protein